MKKMRLYGDDVDRFNKMFGVEYIYNTYYKMITQCNKNMTIKVTHLTIHKTYTIIHTYIYMNRKRTTMLWHIIYNINILINTKKRF